MNSLTEFLIYLGVIFLGVIMILFFILTYFVAKFYKSGLSQVKLINEVKEKIERIQKEFRDFKNKLGK